MPAITVTVSKYGSRNWAVYLNGELLAVTLYKKGAHAIQATITGLYAAASPTRLTAV